MSTALLGIMLVTQSSASVTLYPPPEGEPASADYTVTIDGRPTFCYTSYQFDDGSKTRIAGRPVSPVSFCSFGLDGSARVTVRFLDGLRQAGVNTSSVVVRPLAHGIEPEVRNGETTFIVERPCQLSVEPGGSLKHPLHIFANPPEVEVPSPDDPNVRYYGPGRHVVRGVSIKTGETVYVAAGAIVELQPVPEEERGAPHKAYGLDVYSIGGLFDSRWQKDVTIRGRGIVCGRRAIEQRQRGPLIRVQGIEGLRIEGIIIRESSVWSLNVVNSRGVHIDNVKIVGHYVNNDGIVIGGTSDALVENCFTHNADDSLEVKVWIPQENVTFRNCIVWNDVGGSLGLMHETGADVKNVVFENCTVIHSTDNMSVCPVVGLKLTGPGKASDFRFEDIVIEDVVGSKRAPIKVINNWDDWHRDHPTKPGSPYELLKRPEREEPNGRIRNVLFRNITVLRSASSDVAIISDGPGSEIEGVTFENVVINGRRLVPNDERIKVNEGVSGVEVR